MRDELAISIVVSVRSSPDRLSRCLTGVISSSRPGDEVVVVLRASDESSPAVVQRFSGTAMPLRTVSVAEPGVWPALITGLTDTRNDIVAFLDDAAVPMPGWAGELAAGFTDSSVGGFGGPILSFTDVRTENRFVADGRIAHVDWLGLPRSQLDGWRMERVVDDVDFLPISNMAFRKHLLVDLHRLNVPGAAPNVGMELLFAEAVRSRGLRVVFDSRIRVEHHLGPPSSSDDALPHASEYAYAMTLALTSRSPVARAANSLLGSRVAPGILTLPYCITSGRDWMRRWRGARRGRRSAARDRSSGSRLST